MSATSPRPKGSDIPWNRVSAEGARSRLREARARGWTLGRMAKEWGVNLSTLTSISSGQSVMIDIHTHNVIVRGVMPPAPKQVDKAWLQEAACVGVDPEVFMPRRGGAYDDMARETCAECEVWKECALDAWHADVSYRGRMTPSQRKRWKARVSAGDVAVPRYRVVEELR